MERRVFQVEGTANAEILRQNLDDLFEDAREPVWLEQWGQGQWVQLERQQGDFPGGPVVTSANTGDTSLIPGLGRSQMLQSS